MAEKLKDLYVRRNTGNNYGQESDSWAQRADELNRMAGGALKQGSETAGNGALGWLKDSFDAGAASVFGGTARAAGEFLPFGNETLNSWADYFDEVARNNSPQPGQELKGMDYVASAVGNALGSSGASALEAAVVGSLLGVGGAAGTALGAASRVIPGVGKAVEAGKTLWGSPVGKYLVGKVAGSPFEAVSESGNLITDMRKENQQGTANYTDDEIREAALRSGALNLAWLTGMNMLEAGTLGKITGALGGDMAAKGVKDIAKRATLGGLSSGIGEGAEEYGQNLIGDYSKRGSTADFNYDEAMEAAKMGAIGGGVLGGLGSGLSAKFSKKNSDVSEEIASEDGGTIEETPEATVSGREAFINAIAGQESGGNYNAENSDTGAYGKYQIMPSNWPAWAEEAGIGADAPRTPENQEIVARFKLGQYYDKYGARGAAIAWYGGEGALNYSEEALNRKQGDNGEYPSINEYADEVLGRMGNVADSVRIDDTEENYFDESNYTDDTIPNSLNPVRGFDVSHLDKGTAQDRNSLLYGERVKKAKPAPAGEEVASFNQSLDNSNAEKAPNSLFVNSPRSWDAAERIYKARAKEQAERKARAQAIVNIANAQQQSFLNVLRNRAAQQWDNAEQEYKDRKQDKLQSLANVINARAVQKWDAKEADNAQKAKAEQEKQTQLQNIARLLDARAAQQWDNAEQLHLANTRQSNRENLGALVPVNNAVAPQMSRMGHGELTLQNGRAQGLTDEEQAIINRYQGNPDAFNRKFKESVESVQAAVQRGDITQDVGRAYLKNLANMYDTVIGPIQNNGVIMQGQDAPIRKLVNKMRAKRKQGEVGTEPSLLQENGRVKKNAPADMLVKTSKGWDKAEAEYKARAEEKAEKHTRQQTIADIVNARAAQKWDEAETEYVSSKKGIDVALPEGVTAEAKSVTNKKTGKKEVELKFSGKKISDEFKKKLRAHGFNWNVGRKAWVAEENIVTKAVAEKLAQKDNVKAKEGNQAEETTEPAQDKADSVQTKRTKAKQAIDDAPKGKTVEATTDNGVKFGVQYAIVPADSLITSNNASDFSNNEAYPQELQPRDRNRAYMRLQVEKMSGTIEPERITTGTSVNEGAPIVNKEGVVENGNGRTMALVRMWRSGNKKLQKAYRDYLAKNAVKFGLLSSSLKGIDNPILVRIRTDNNVSVSEVTDSTKGGAQLSTAEQALQDSKKLKDSTLAKYEQNRLGTIDNAKNAEFVRAVFQDIIPEDELNAYTTTDGSLSKSGRQRAVNAILAKAYGADPVLFNLVESTDEAYGKIGDALIAAAPTIAKLKALASNQTLFDVDLAGEILKAIKFVSNAKANNMAVFDAVSQQSMFADYNVDELTKKLALFIDNNKGAKWKNIVDMVTVSADVIAKKGSPLQGNVFGEEVKAPTAEEVLTTAINRVTNGEATAIIRMNDEKGQIEIKFVGNVSESVKKKLAKAKFKLSLEEQMWHAARNAASMKVAKELGYEEQGGNNGSISIFDEEAQAERNAGETASTESNETEEKQPAESNQDEVKEAAEQPTKKSFFPKRNEQAEKEQLPQNNGDTAQGEKLNLPKGTTAEVSIVGDNSNIIQVKFNGEQGKGTSGIMGRAGYKWKSDKQLWQARKTEKAMDVAKQLGYTEEAKPQERDYELERTARQQRLQESNERATQSLIAQNKDESVPGKKYTVRNKFFSVNILDGIIRVKDASKINPQDNQFNFSLSVEEYQRAAQNGNRLAGISKLLKAKIREGLENWIEESPNERTKEVRKQQNDEATLVQAADEHFENAYPLIEKVLQKAGIEAVDHQTLFERAKKAKPSADTFSKNPDALFNSEDKSQQTDKYKNYSKEDIKINKERLATMPDVDGILQPAAKIFAEFFKARFPKSDYTNETVDFWNNYTLEFEQLNKILKKYRKAVQQGNLSMADAHFQQISSSFDRINDLLEKLVGNDKEMRQEFVDSITPVFDEYHKIVDEHNAKDNAKKTSKAKKQQGKQEYKYYLNARPADIGAVPKGFIRVDAEDKGGRYGAIYYDRQLSDKEVQQYELKSDADVSKEKAQTEAVKEVSRELLKSEKVAMQAKNNTLADFTLAYYDDIENYLADHIEENPVYADLLNDPVIIDKAIESESIIKNTYEKLRGKSSSEETTDKLSKNNKTADKQEAKQQKSNYDYGDKKAILKDLLAATGLKEKNSKVEDVEGLDYSDAGLEEALNELAKECSKLSANPMFNPALYRAAAKVGLIFLKRTGRNFKRWAKALLDWFRKNRPEEENKIKPFLGAIYKNIENWPKNLAFKEDIVELSCRLVGSSYAEGNTSFEAVYRDIVDMAGEENAQALRGYLEQAYLAVDELENPTLTLDENVVESKQDKGGSQYDSNSTESLFSDDTGFGNTGNEIRTTSKGKEPRGSNGQGSKTSERESERNGYSGVHGSRTSAGGKTSVREGSQEASSTDGDASGSTGLSDSVIDSLQEQPNVNEGAVKNIVESASDGRVNATDEVTQKVNEVIKENNLDKRRADRLQQTAKVMPFLTAIQLHNTDFVAERFDTNGKQGVMITDGTGTGKTFSGLAIVKKMVGEGKKNIIIAAPNDTIINQWIESARDFYNLEVTRLKDTDDAGEGIVITTYANFGENEELVNRNWDMVICDESHNLMNSESGKTTNILSRLRLLTYHPTELRNRAEQTILSEDKIEARKIVRKALALKTKEPESLSAKERSIISASERIQANSEDKLTKEETAQIEAQAKEWEELNESEKPKVMFLSATPFAYVNDIDYANGYLFDYPKLEGQGYNQPNGLQQFLMEHFGYRMRYNKLTKPDGSVDNALMEMEFHEWLRNTGALTGHELETDKDYNRGFILVDQGVGRQIDEGFEFLRENKEKYGNLEGVLNKQFDGRRRNYLLESIKARASVPIIREYLKTGKKSCSISRNKRGTRKL